MDDGALSIHLLQRLPHQRCIFRIDDQNLGASMHERESDICSIEAGIQRIEYSAKHRHGKMCFDHLRNIRCNDRHVIEPFDPKLCQCRCEPDTAIKELRVSTTTRAVDHCHLVGERACGASQKADRRQWYVVGRMSIQTRLERVRVVCIHWITTSFSANESVFEKLLFIVSKPRDRHRRRSRFRSCRNQPPKPAAEAALRAPAIRQAVSEESALSAPDRRPPEKNRR